MTKLRTNSGDIVGALRNEGVRVLYRKQSGGYCAAGKSVSMEIKDSDGNTCAGNATSNSTESDRSECSQVSINICRYENLAQCLFLPSISADAVSGSVHFSLVPFIDGVNQTVNSVYLDKLQHSWVDPAGKLSISEIQTVSTRSRSS